MISVAPGLASRCDGVYSPTMLYCSFSQLLFCLLTSNFVFPLGECPLRLQSSQMSKYRFAAIFVLVLVVAQLVVPCALGSNNYVFTALTSSVGHDASEMTQVQSVMKWTAAQVTSMWSSTTGDILSLEFFDYQDNPLAATAVAVDQSSNVSVLGVISPKSAVDALLPFTGHVGVRAIGCHSSLQLHPSVNHTHYSQHY